MDVSDNHRGRVYIAYVVSRGAASTDTDIVLRYSDNQGAEGSWSDEKIIHGASVNSQFHPALCVDPRTGTVVVAYYDAREDLQNKKVAVYLATSEDGGDTWTDRRISDYQSDQSMYTQQESKIPPIASDPNYLEYIGVSAYNGTAYVVWSDNHVDQADLDYYTDYYKYDNADWYAHSDFEVIDDILGVATDGDRVFLDIPRTYPSFTLSKNVEVIATASNVVIDGSGTQYAVEITGSGGLVDGLSLQGGSAARAYVSQGTLQNCALSGDGLGVELASGTVSNCTITGGSGTGFGVALGGSGLISDCTISFVSGWGILAQEYAWKGTVRNTRMSFSSPSVGSTGIYSLVPDGPTIENCRIEMAKGLGILLEGGHATVSKDTILVNAFDGSNIGIKTMQPANDGGFTITHCLVTALGGTGIDVNTSNNRVENCTVDGAVSGVVDLVGGLVTTSIASNCTNYGFTVANGATYCIAWPNGFSPNSQWTGSVVEDPLYCGSGDYTLRIDSYGNPENPDNTGHSQIGAFPVACAYGDLSRNSVFSGTASVSKDLRVPSGRILTLHAGAALKFDQLDESYSGASGSKVELTVKNGGRLTVDGSWSNRSKFISSKSSPGTSDWWGIVGESGSKIFFSYGELRHAQYGLASTISTYDTLTVAHSVFAENMSRSVYLNGGGRATITADTITVGAGSGIEMPAVGTTAISDCKITGNGSSTNGIYIHGGDFAASPEITGNYVSGFTNGNAIWMDPLSSYQYLHDPILKGNSLLNSKRGFYVTRGGAAIGEGASDFNYIRGNTTGIYVRCIVPPSQPCQECISTVLVRYNKIVSNTVGIASEKTSSVNAGTASEDGGNEIRQNSAFCITNVDSCQMLYAMGNYFGPCPVTDCTAGLVNIDEALCSSPFNGLGTPVDVVALDAPKFRLLGAVPNPTQGSSTLQFELGADGARVQGRVFDVAGRLIQDLGSAPLGPGKHEMTWNGEDVGGKRVPSGIYFFRLTSNKEFAGTWKVLVSR